MSKASKLTEREEKAKENLAKAGLDSALIDQAFGTARQQENLKAKITTKPTEHEMRAILALADAGINSTTIGEAFGMPRQQVAAYRAWRTMRTHKNGHKQRK